MSRLARAWLRTYRPTPRASLRLVCFPHGGGSASFFRPWALAAPADVEVVAVQYPGREDRRDEAPLTDMAQLADGAMRAIAEGVMAPLALFGHSMGALVAFETARRLEARGIVPQRLIVSGKEAPDRALPSAKHRLDDERLWADLRRLGGTPALLLESDELRALVLPTLRADYRLVEEYEVVDRTPIEPPISAFTGDADPDVECERVEGWREWTTGEYELTVFAGDHFYLVPERERVLDAALAAAGAGLALAAAAPLRPLSLTSEEAWWPSTP